MKKIVKQFVWHHEKEENSTNEKQNADDSTPITNPPSSPNSSSSSSYPNSTPKKMSSLNDVYSRCNFCILELKNFEETYAEKEFYTYYSLDFIRKILYLRL